MVVHTENRQLKINWNLIQETSEDNCELSSAEKGVLSTHTHTHIGHCSFTVRKCKRFRFPIDLELQGNSSLIYYNPLAA